MSCSCHCAVIVVLAKHAYGGNDNKDAQSTPNWQQRASTRLSRLPYFPSHHDKHSQHNVPRQNTRITTNNLACRRKSKKLV